MYRRAAGNRFIFGKAEAVLILDAHYFTRHPLNESVPQSAKRDFRLAKDFLYRRHAISAKRKPLAIGDT